MDVNKPNKQMSPQPNLSVCDILAERLRGPSYLLIFRHPRGNICE
jgi:hypothetical protein